MAINEIFASIAVNILSSALWLVGGYLVYKSISYYNSRNERWFWGRFKDRNLHIIFREYKINSSSHEEEVAKSVGDGFQVSKGMAISMGALVSYCGENVTKPSNITATGDQTTTFELNKESPICLGSKNNLITKRVLNEVERYFVFPFDTSWDKSNKVIFIKYLTLTNREYRPNIDNGSGEDYALVVNAQLPNGPVLIVAGAHMWGTQAAVAAITDRIWLKAIRKKFSSSKDFAFILRVRVENDKPEATEIVHAIKLDKPLNNS